MTDRDDMVLRPRLDPRRTGRSVPVRARAERAIARATGDRSALRRVSQVYAARRLAKLRRLRKRYTRRSRRGSVLGASRTTAGISRAAGVVGRAAGPIAAVVTALLAGGAVAGRLATGRSFQNMGAQLNKMLLGDLDEQALAAMKTRQQLLTDDDIARIVGVEGRVNDQITRVYRDLEMMNKRDALGRALIEEAEDFQSNNTLDILLARGKEKFVAAFSSNGGAESIHRLENAFAKRHGQARSNVN